MNRVKLLSFLVVGLLISNLALLGFMVFGKGKHKRPEGPRNIITERLHLTPNQIAKYDELIKWHRTEIRLAEQEIMGLKNQLYEGLSQVPNPQLNDSLINRIALAQSKIEVTHLKHFQDIKQLCSEEQQREFNVLSKELADLFSRRPKH
jgi:hypothetical protein